MILPIDWIHLELARIAAERSTCLHWQVGAILYTSQGIAHGCNRQPLGMVPCTQRGYCEREGFHCGNQGTPSRAIHAEIEALAMASIMRLPTWGSHLYCTHKPCPNCLKSAAAFGVRAVTWTGEPYALDSEWHGVFKLTAI